MKKKVLAIVIWILTAAVAVTAGVLAFTEECDHKWNDWEIVEATCTQDGTKTHTCKRCDAVETEVLKAEGHKPSREKTKTPTCTE